MQNKKLAELLHQYFELGVAEGREGRNHDTEAGDAQRVLSEIEAEIVLASPAPPAAVKALEWIVSHPAESNAVVWDIAQNALSGQVPDDADTAAAIDLGAAVLSKIVDPSVRETAIRNALTAASNRNPEPTMMFGRWVRNPTEQLYKFVEKQPTGPDRAQVRDAATPSVTDFADRLFNLHGFVLSEVYRGKHAVTVTFPNLAEAQQFHGALIELSQHKTAPAKQEANNEL